MQRPYSMTYLQLLQALEKLGPDALQKQVQIFDYDDGKIYPVDTFITGKSAMDLTEDPFQSLLAF